MNKNISIAIDGPAGSGKSTIAKKLIKFLPNFIHVNTGAMYRALAYYFWKNNLNYNDENVRSYVIDKIKILLNNDDIFIDDNDEIQNVKEFINNEDIANITSEIANFIDIRKKLINDQQLIAKNNNIIMDGRDIGTVVLPNATIKFFISASVETRALRRWNQLCDNAESIDEIKYKIMTRDNNDYNRKFGALKKADDAIELNTDNLNVEQCCKFIINKLNNKL